MQRIKRHLLDESGSSEASSTVFLISAVGILLAGALAVYWSAFTTFFSKVAAVIEELPF